MRRLLLHFFFLVCSITYTHTAFTQTIKAGIHAGLLFTRLNLSPTDADEPALKTRLAYQIALPVEVGLQGIFAIQPELLYAQHGARFDQTVSIVEGSGSSNAVTITKHNEGWIRIQNLEIPVLAKVKFGSKHFKMHLLAGPGLGFGLSGKSRRIYEAVVTQMDGSVTSVFREDRTLTVVFKKEGYDAQGVNVSQQAITGIHMNLHTGVGFEINIGKATVFLDGRYILGLNDLFPEPEGFTDEAITAKSSRMGIYAGVLFTLKG